MADETGYDAGSIFVQVVPSFRDTQRIIGAESKKFGDKLEKDIAGGMEEGAKKGAKKASKVMQDELGKGNDEAGKKAAEEYAGAFRTELGKAVKSMQREIEPIELRTASTKTLAELEKVKAALKALSETKIEPGMDVRGLMAEASKVKGIIEGIAGDLDIDVKFDTKAATAQWNGLIKRIEALQPKIEVKIDKPLAERELGQFEKMFKARVKAAADAIGQNIKGPLGQLKDDLRTLADNEIGIDIHAGDAMAQLESISFELAKINAFDPEVDVRVDSNQALRELQKINREVDTLDGKTKKAEKGRGLIDRLLGRGKGGDGQEVANAFRAFNGVILTTLTLGPALIPVLAALAGGMAALGPAALAGVSGVGVLALAFHGVGEAVGALNEAQETAVKDTVASGRTMRAAAEGVEDAQRSLARARRDAAQAGVDAEKAVADAAEAAAQRNQDAIRRVQAAREQATRAVEQALRRQQDAEKRLADAQRDAKEAQEDLAAARLQAVKDLDDIADRSKQNALDIRQAQIDLFNATVANNAAQADPGSTNLEREQADINLQNARLRMEELRETQGELVDEKKKGDQKGVDGTARVQTAQERLNDALRAQKDAQDDVAESAADLRQIQLQGAQDVAQALADQRQARIDGAQSVADALENQRRVEISSRESVEDAQRGLARAQQNYKDALYDTGVQGSASMQKVQSAFDKLTPAGKAFALFLFSLKDEFRELQGIAAEGILPGVQDFLELMISTYGPGLKDFVRDISAVIAGLTDDLGESLTGPAWKTFFKLFAEAGPQFLEDFGGGFIDWLEVSARFFAIVMPYALKFSGYLADLAEKAALFMESEEGQKMWTDFFEYVERIGPKVKDFFLALGGAVLAIGKALAPIGEDVLTLLTNMLNWIATMDPETLQLILIVVLGLAAAFQIAALATFLLATATQFLTSPLQLIVVAVLLVALALYTLYTRSETARKIIDAVFAAIGAVATWLFDKVLKPFFAYAIWIWGKIGEAAQWAWENLLKPAFQAFGDFASWLWNKILKPVFGAIITVFAAVGSALKWTWENIIWPVLKVLGKIVWELWEFTMKLVFANIKTGFEALGTAMTWVWDHVLKPLFDIFMKYIGNDLVKAFETAVGFIKKHWDTLKGIAMAPITFMVDTVLNKGLIVGFNKLADVFQMDKVEPIPWPPPGYATGGVYPGYTPGRDIGYIGVSGGEAIMRPEWTRAMRQLDPDYIEEANRRARTGGVGAVRQFLGGFRNGGEVRGTPGIYDRTTFRGKQFDVYTVKLIQAAENLLGQTIKITQGSYSTSVAQSGSTHAGGGALDAGWTGNALVAALRKVGFAAWHRDPSQGDWNHHVHAIAIGNPTASPAAQRQVADYMRGGNGLGGKDDGPNVPKDPSLIGRIIGGVGDIADWATSAIGKPLEYLKGLVAKPLGELKEKFGENKLTELLAGMGNKIIEGAANFIKGFSPIGGGGKGDKNGLKAMAQEMLSGYNWDSQWGAFDWLVTKESGWNPKAQNPNSTAYGLGQFLDSTWGANAKTSDPRTQLKLMMDYISDRYGSPEKAKEFHQAHGWYKDGGVVPDNLTSAPIDLYDTGGVVPEGLSGILNLTGANEHAAVFTTDQWERLQAGSDGGITINVPMQPTNATPADVADEILFAARRIKRGGAYAGSN